MTPGLSKCDLLYQLSKSILQKFHRQIDRCVTKVSLANTPFLTGQSAKNLTYLK